VATTDVTPARLWGALERIPDPEMPAVTLGDLGMVIDVRVDCRRVEADLLPTYSGCPATDMIREDARAAVLEMDGVDEVEVRLRSDLVWTPDRITAAGREKLRAFGIAPPGSGHGGPILLGIGRVTCPLCGSRDTVADSPFGPTPCRSTHYCAACRNPFEAIKD
jgi:ring-1,2-phenylacetyl-CoA epoxidase subunit PaaD